MLLLGTRMLLSLQGNDTLARHMRRELSQSDHGAAFEPRILIWFRNLDRHRALYASFRRGRTGLFASQNSSTSTVPFIVWPSHRRFFFARHAAVEMTGRNLLVPVSQKPSMS